MLYFIYSACDLFATEIKIPLIIICFKSKERHINRKNDLFLYNGQKAYSQYKTSENYKSDVNSVFHLHRMRSFYLAEKKITFIIKYFMNKEKNM